MDKFNHSDNIGLNRRDLFSSLQDMIYGNISKLVRGIYNWESLKIICGNSELGLLPTSDFEVTYSTGNLYVAPGVATNDDTSLIFVETSLPLSSAGDNGAYYVYVTYQQNKALTGKEVPLPAKGNINTDNLYTLLTDGATIAKASSVPTGSIGLAKVVIAANVVPSSESIGGLTRDLYMDETGILLSTIFASPTLPAWATDYLGNNIAIKIDNEYLRVNSSGLILERGYLGTIVEHHYSGTVANVLSIIDLRQQSLLTMRGSDAIETAISRGVVVTNGGVRSLATRKIVRHNPTPPVISSSSSPILWVNRSRSMGMITNKVKNIYYGIQSARTNVDNGKAIIADCRYRMLGASDEEMVPLAAEMRRAQQDLIAANNIQQEMLASLSAEEISGYMASVPNLFNYVVNIAHPTMAADGVVQYEAEVVRSPISAMSDTYGMGNAEKIYTERIRPTGYSIDGDAIYPTRSTSEQTMVKIPITLGERVSVRVRPINENEIYGDYSNTLTYEFTRFDDNEYVSYQNIYGLIMPDILTNVATLNEYVSYIKDMWDQMSSTNEQMRSYQNTISQMQDQILDIYRTLSLVQPVIPIVPRLQAIANTASTTTSSS